MMAAELHAANREYENEKLDTKTVFKNNREKALSFQWFLRGWSKAKEDESKEINAVQRGMEREETDYYVAVFGLVVSFMLWMFSFFALFQAILSQGFMAVFGVANLAIVFYVLASGLWVGCGLWFDREKRIFKWRKSE